MIINYGKTKLMVFNPCKTVDFCPELEFGNEQLQMVEEMRLLGVTVRSDLKWISNTEDIVKRALNKLWIVRRLKSLGASTKELVDIYNKHCRSIVEFGVPAWHGAITRNERVDIERVHRRWLYTLFWGKGMKITRMPWILLSWTPWRTEETNSVLNLQKKQRRIRNIRNGLAPDPKHQVDRRI